jgi:hypothetical protein
VNVSWNNNCGSKFPDEMPLGEEFVLKAMGEMSWYGPMVLLYEITRCKHLFYLNIYRKLQDLWNKYIGYNMHASVSSATSVWNTVDLTNIYRVMLKKCTVMHVSLHVKHPLLLSILNQNWHGLRNFSKILQYLISWKLVQQFLSC